MPDFAGATYQPRTNAACLPPDAPLDTIYDDAMEFTDFSRLVAI